MGSIKEDFRKQYLVGTGRLSSDGHRQTIAAIKFGSSAVNVITPPALSRGASAETVAPTCTPVSPKKKAPKAKKGKKKAKGKGKGSTKGKATKSKGKKQLKKTKQNLFGLS